MARLLVALMFVTGCGGGVAAVEILPAADGGGGAVTEGAEAGSSSGSGERDAGVRDSALRDAPAEADPPLEAVPSRQTVTFQISNSSGAERWVALDTGSQEYSPISCEGYGLMRANSPLHRLPGFQCGCECPNPGSPRYSLKRVPAGGSLTVTWDARALAARAYAVDCSLQGWPNGGKVTMSRVALRPVEAGPIDATFAVLPAVPADCRAGASPDTAECGGPSGYAPGMFGPFAQTCRPAPLRVSFVLPAAGDLSVPVSLP